MYEKSTEWLVNIGLDFAFVRDTAAPGHEHLGQIFGDIPSITEDTIIRAYYRFPDEVGGQLPPQMPDAGAGAMSGLAAPVDCGAVSPGRLASQVYARWRRR